MDQFIKDQIWHLDDYSVTFDSHTNDRKIESKNSLSYDSEYYGLKQEGKAVSFSFKNRIETIINYIK